MARRLARDRSKALRIFRAFGYGFTHLPAGFREDLWSLEREGAIYADHWVDELADARHVRIPLTQDEAKDYARRLWAYELYLRKGKPKWAHDVPGIDSDIAHDADTYSPKLDDGSKIAPPCLWPAAFMGSRLESKYVLLHDGHKIYASCDVSTVSNLDPDATCGFRPLRTYKCTVQSGSIEKATMPMSDLKCEDGDGRNVYLYVRKKE